MKRAYIVLILIVYFLGESEIFATPNNEGNPEQSHEEGDNTNFEDFGLEYGRYLQQVVQALEQDSDFAKRLENISAEEIKSGNVAKELEFVQHSVRSKLDELKRIELERLRSAAQKQLEINQLGLYRDEDGRLMEPPGEHRRWRTIKHPAGVFQDDHLPNHLNPHNPHTFEIDDLKKLIQSANKDLEEIDKKRKEEFKKYEMEKELQYRSSLANLTEEERKVAEKRHEDLKKKHQDHPSIHHPGSKQQLEQVWEEQDKLPKEEFDPKVFFAMHDTNQDGFLDEQEVESILTIEIRKMYDPSRNPEEDDPVEMMEEYNRMREHIYSETDKDKDRLISKQEFLDMTKKDDFNKDEGWKDIEDQTHFSETEFKAFEKSKEKTPPRKGAENEKYQPIVHQKEKMPEVPVPIPYKIKVQEVKGPSNPEVKPADNQEMGNAI